MTPSRHLSYLFLSCAFLLIMGVQAFCAERQKAILLLEHEESAPWIELLRRGLERGGEDFNFSTKLIYASEKSTQTEIFRNAAAEADLVLVATDNFHEILRDNAANFRRVKFGCLDAGIRAPNIMSVTFADEQASFLAGLAAAMFVEKADPSSANSKKAAAWLSGADSPAMRSLANGYAEGIKLASQKCQFAQAITGSFTDPQAAAQKTQWLLDSGALVIALAAGVGNSAALSLLEKNNFWHIALDGYLPNTKPLGLISKRTDQAVYEIMRSAASEKFAGKEILIYDLANGGVNFELSEDFLKHGPKIKNDIARRIKELKSEIISGSIRLPSLRARTLCDCLD